MRGEIHLLVGYQMSRRACYPLWRCRRRVAAAGPDSQDHDGSQRDFQRDWEVEQEWLKECAEPCHEIGPWGDLVG